MINSFIRGVVKGIPVFLILYVASSMAGLDLMSLNIMFYSIVALLVGIVYGIILVYQSPSPEFMEMIMKEEKVMKEEKEGE